MREGLFSYSGPNRCLFGIKSKRKEGYVKKVSYLVTAYHFTPMEKQYEDAIYEITPLSEKDCFYIIERYKSECTFPLHSHAEYELNFVENGRGIQRIVGDSIEEIGDYDLTLITGRELKHAWKQHKCTSKKIREITIQFSSDLFFGSLLSKNQFNSILHMLEKARVGCSFPLSAILKVYSLLDRLASEQGFYAVLKFLTILYELSLCESRPLSSSSFACISDSADSRRVQKIYAYINRNYNKEIRLAQLAELVGMSPTAFSRFFSQRTGKNLSDYLIEIRLGHAVRMLVNTTQSVSEICFECGFNNISNFNRIFKRKKGCSPKEFRSNYQRVKKII